MKCNFSSVTLHLDDSDAVWLQENRVEVIALEHDVPDEHMSVRGRIKLRHQMFHQRREHIVLVRVFEFGSEVGFEGHRSLGEVSGDWRRVADVVHAFSGLGFERNAPRICAQVGAELRQCRHRCL